MEEMQMNREWMRRIPGINEILETQMIQDEIGSLPHRIVVAAARNVTEELRRAILADAISEEDLVFDHIMVRIIDEARRQATYSMRRVINGTGIPLNTNLGRSPMPKSAISNLHDVACGYSNLEYDVEAGCRGSRHDHLAKVMRDITGAEDIMVVNNNAAATMLTLAALAVGGEVVISRGELIEIGGAFRIPEIMEQSGSVLCEVGTTNKTRLSDYERAIGEETKAILKVHTSNYKIIGFSEDVTPCELVELAHRNGLPLIYDLGSGLMMDLSSYGISEPTVFSGIASGADVVLFSGDKLLGGPQCGILAGKHEYIEQMRRHPLARAFRVGKMTIAALEAAMHIYYDMEQAKQEIPVLHMLTIDEKELSQRADRLAQMLDEIEGINATSVETENQVGGGSAPGITLPGRAVALTFDKCSVQEAERNLRITAIPIIARIHKDQLLIETRTVFDDEHDIIAEALRHIVTGEIE